MAEAVAVQQIQQFVQRIERLEEQKKQFADDIAAVYAEAKACGFDVKIMREIIRERKMSREDQTERLELLELYRNALGDLVDTPLGVAALNRAAA